MAGYRAVRGLSKRDYIRIDRSRATGFQEVERHRVQIERSKRAATSGSQPQQMKPTKAI
jgi:hypothetical protein